MLATNAHRKDSTQDLMVRFPVASTTIYREKAGFVLHTIKFPNGKIWIHSYVTTTLLSQYHIRTGKYWTYWYPIADKLSTEKRNRVPNEYWLLNLKVHNKPFLANYGIQIDTLIWFRAESFKPVMSKTFIQVPICRPCFFVAEG